MKLKISVSALLIVMNLNFRTLTICTALVKVFAPMTIPGGTFVSIASEAYLKGELQRESKLISYERAFKMLENDMYIAGFGQAVLELLSFKVRPGNHQRGIFLVRKFSVI